MEAVHLDRFTTLKMTDTVVVQRVLDGEKELFEILIRRYNQRLYRVIRGYLNVDADIEDIMQDTYIKTYKKLDQFKGTSSFSTWLIRIGINETLQYLRKVKKSVNDSKNREVISQLNQLPDLTIPTNDAEAEVQTKHHMLEKVIEQLDEKYRVVFMLYEIEGLLIEEIADCLELTKSNVKVRLFRARSFLKEALYKQSKDTEIFTFGNKRCDNVVTYVLDRV